MTETPIYDQLITEFHSRDREQPAQPKKSASAPRKRAAKKTASPKRT